MTCVRLVVRDDRSMVGRDEGIVGGELLAGGRLPWTGKRPDGPAAARHDQESTVAPIRDQEATREPRRRTGGEPRRSGSASGPVPAGGSVKVVLAGVGPS